MIGRQKICLLLSNDVIDFSQLAVYLPPQYPRCPRPNQEQSSVNLYVKKIYFVFENLILRDRLSSLDQIMRLLVMGERLA